MQRCAASVAQRFFLGCARRQGWALPFWPSGLTLRSSGLAFSQPLTLAVSLRKIRNIEAHVLFTGVYLLKRLFVGFWISRRASPFGAAPVFSFFASIASLPWHTAFSRFALVVNLGLPILASVANRAVKPTCLRQAAYFRSLVPSPALCAQPLISALGPVPKAF